MSYENLNNLKRGHIKSNNQISRRSDISGNFGQGPNRMLEADD
jgi:hypothetical protein